MADLTPGQCANRTGAATFTINLAISVGDLISTSHPDGRVTVTPEDLAAWQAAHLAPARAAAEARMGTAHDLVSAAKAGFERPTR